MATRRKKTTKARTIRGSDGRPWKMVRDANTRRLMKADPIGYDVCWNDHVARMNEDASLEPWKDKPLWTYSSFYRWHGLLLDITTNLATRTSTFKIKG